MKGQKKPRAGVTIGFRARSISCSSEPVVFRAEHATSLPRQRDHVIRPIFSFPFCTKAIFAVATSFKHQDHKIFRFFCHWKSNTLSPWRCRCREAKQLPPSQLWYYSFGPGPSSTLGSAAMAGQRQGVSNHWRPLLATVEIFVLRVRS